MIEVTPDITLNDDEITERFIRAAGPGGQNVKNVRPIKSRLIKA
jgi:ribosome-associated protein